jgi:hypothetical protein
MLRETESKAQGHGFSGLFSATLPILTFIEEKFIKLIYNNNIKLAILK